MNISPSSALSLLLTGLLAATLFTGCSDDPDDTQSPDAGHQTDADIDSDIEPDADSDAETLVDLELDSISPESGDIAGGTTVTLSGQGFAEGMTVHFGDLEATQVTRYGGLSAEAVTPAAAEGIVDVIIENPDGEQVTFTDAFTYTEDIIVVPEGNVGHCQLQPAPGDLIEAAPGQDFGPIYAYVFAEGLTQGAGQGSGIDAELGVGTDATDLTWHEMDYFGDIDGLTGGDLANDEYNLTLSLEDAGNYVYLARFRAANDDDWVVCGLVGPLDSMPGENDLGRIEITEPDTTVERPESCGIQFPLIAQSNQTGDEITLYGRVYEPGLTDLAELPDEFLGQALVGPADANPEADLAAFTIINAQRNPVYAAADFEEFDATYPIDEAGTWAYVYRFSLDSGDNWTYCEIDGISNEDELDPTRFGTILAGDAEPEPIDYCHTFYENMSGTTDTDGPQISMEIYQADITDVPDSPGDSGEFEIQGGFGLAGTNPALGGYSWSDLAYLGINPDQPNNDEYAGLLYEEADAPDAGQYHAITRARLIGEETWTYCTNDSGASNFSLDPPRANTLEIQ